VIALSFFLVLSDRSLAGLLRSPSMYAVLDLAAELC
jgi:hypothetical protein